MATKAQLEKYIISLRRQKGGIKSDRTKIKADLVRVKKRLASAHKRLRGLRADKAEITGDLRKSKRKVNRLEKTLEKVSDSNKKLLTAMDDLEEKNLKFRNHGRKYMEECEVLKKKVQELEDDLARCKAQHG